MGSDEDELWEGFSDPVTQEQSALSTPVERETKKAMKATKATKARKKTQKTFHSETKVSDSGPENSFELLSDETGGGVDGMRQHPSLKRYR